MHLNTFSTNLKIKFLYHYVTTLYGYQMKNLHVRGSDIQITSPVKDTLLWLKIFLWLAKKYIHISL